jgi:hypothetical protein
MIVEIREQPAVFLESLVEPRPVVGVQFVARGLTPCVQLQNSLGCSRRSALLRGESLRLVPHPSAIGATSDFDLNHFVLPRNRESRGGLGHCGGEKRRASAAATLARFETRVDVFVCCGEIVSQHHVGRR